MAQANSFSHIGAACVRVLARQAAINAVKSELQRRGERVHSVPMRDIYIQADDYLRQHPHLIGEAAERAQLTGSACSRKQRHCISHAVGGSTVRSNRGPTLTGHS